MFIFKYENLAVKLNSAPLIIPHTKLEAISSNDVGADRVFSRDTYVAINFVL